MELPCAVMRCSNFQCMDAAQSSAFFSSVQVGTVLSLGRGFQGHHAYQVDFLGHATMCLELLMEGTQLPSKWRSFPFLLCMDFSEKGNRIISSLLCESLRYRSVLWREVGDQITLAVQLCGEEKLSFCVITQARKAGTLQSWPSLDLLTSLPLGQGQRRGCCEQTLSISA